MLSIDLNCDLGESFGNYVIGNDEKVIDYISSVNIACGFHAGDPLVMEKTVKMALEKNVSIGAHPGFQDLQGFGRREFSVSLEEARALVIYQVGALNGFVKANCGKLHHVKPHGALYNMAAKDYKVARAIAQAVYDIDSELVFLGLSNSMLITAARDVGLTTANEVFADRAYNVDGSLVSRNIEGAVIHDTKECITRVLRMIRENKVTAIDGSDIDIMADSVCIHGDNPMAVEFAAFLKKSLKENMIELRTFGAFDRS